MFYSSLFCFSFQCLKLTDSDVDYRLVTALTGSRASQSIRCLSFAYCENFGDAALSVILNSVPNLERLDLTQCQLLTADSASLFQLECAPILKVLNLAELEIIDSAWLLTAFSRYARGIAPIQLCLETCRNITDDDVLLLGRTFADRLLELDISDNQRLSNAAISHISQYCNKIKWLNLSGCDAFSDEPLRNLLVCCRELEELVVENCANISFEFDETTSSQDFASPMALNNLESLDIDDASVAVMVDSVALSTSLTSLKSKQSGLSVVAMLSLARFCPNLSKIDMCECRRASMSSRSTLPKIAFWKFFVHPHLSIRTLTELHLSHAASLDDTFLSSIFRQHSKTLRVLSLSQFPDFSVNDHVISEIAHTCIQLSRLTLNNCSGVTDVGISYFTDSTAAISLSYFNLSGCEQVTALSALKLVIAAGRSSRALQSLLQDDDDYVEYDDEIQQTVTREDALCQLEVQANNEQYSPSLPYLSVVQVKFSGVGEFGTNLLKHARLLQEFDTVNYHWAEKFF
jgi:Leucine-rich repeat (LRR) protein